MAHPHDILFDESFDWDESEVRDLIRTTPLRFNDEGRPADDEAEQLLDFDEIDLMGRFR